MKMYEGFHAFAYEVRWIPPSIPRGRPEGFWQKTGHSVNLFYEETLVWFGGRGGLTRAAIAKKDSDGTPVYQPCPGPTWEGVQRVHVIDEKNYYEDIWDIEENWPDDITVAHGPIKVMWETFDSTWTAYMKSVPNGLYADRNKVREGLQLPLVDDKGCYDVAYEAIWS